jgi:chromosome partitioning protein
MKVVMEKFLTTEEVASRLHLHQNTVIRYIRDGKLPAVKVGKSYRIKETAVSALVGEESEPSGLARVICVSNQKGGVAKTTTAVNLAASLGKNGKTVLLIDLDPQGGCAVCLGMDTSSLQRTVYDVLVKQGFDIGKVIMKTAFSFDLAPSNIDLAGAEVELKQVLAQESVLKRRLHPVLNQYDYIIIDTPPSLGILTVNALTSSDHVLIPISCEYMALRGLKMLLDSIENVQTVTNPKLKILGILATKYDTRTVNSREVYDYLSQFSSREGITLFNPVIKQSVRFTEAPNYGKPLVDLHPDLDGARAYQQVAEEILHG